MKEKFKAWLITTKCLEVDSILMKVTDTLDIINCDQVEKAIIEELLGSFLDTLSTQDLAKLC